MAVGGQKMLFVALGGVLGIEAFCHESYQFVSAALLVKADYCLHSGAYAIPGEWSTGIFPGSFSKADIPRYNYIILPGRVIVIIGAGMTSRECPEVILNMERFDEIDILSAKQLENICSKSGSYIGFRNQYADIFVEPLGIESCPASRGTEGGLVDIVVDVTVDIVFLSHFLDGKGSLYASDEFVVFYIRHHLVAPCQLVRVSLDLFIREGVNLCSVVAVGEIMDFGPYLGEQVVIVDIGAPHRFVHIRHQSYVRVAENRADARGFSEDAYFLCNLFPCPHYGADISSRNPFQAA